MKIATFNINNVNRRLPNLLAWLAERGIPGCLYGPGSIDDAHTSREFVPIDQLIATSKVVALTMLDWCNRAPAD